MNRAPARRPPASSPAAEQAGDEPQRPMMAPDTAIHRRSMTRSSIPDTLDAGLARALAPGSRPFFDARGPWRRRCEADETYAPENRKGVWKLGRTARQPDDKANPKWFHSICVVARRPPLQAQKEKGPGCHFWLDCHRHIRLAFPSASIV